MPFLQHGPVEAELQSPLTFLVGKNGSGKTTLLEAVAVQCAICPGGGYAGTDGDRGALPHPAGAPRRRPAVDRRGRHHPPADILPWRDMRRFMADPAALGRLLA